MGFDLDSLIEKENRQVGREWDAFLTEVGDVWYDDMTPEQQKKACDLAEMQGLRLVRRLEKLGVKHA